MSAQSSKDVSMVDVSKVENAPQGQGQVQGEGQGQPPIPGRRKSTLILTDDMDVDKKPQGEENMDVDQKSGSISSGGSGPSSGSESQTSQNPPAVPPEQQISIPVEIKWTQGGVKVYVTGSFTGWRKMIGLVKQPDGNFAITLGLPIGTHRFRFIVDNELRFSDFLPTATDQMGNFVNYVEVTQESIQSHLDSLQQQEELKQKQQQDQLASQVENSNEEQKGQSLSRKSSTKSRSNSLWGLTNDDDDMGNGYSRYHEEVNNKSNQYDYITDIPPIFTDPKVMEQYYMAIDKQAKSQNGSQQAWLHPPQLPPHLENVILNNFNSMDNNSGALPIPNHVVLNHLATTSIKHNTLAVASVVRYKRKYVTQILYAPLQQ